jgi:hypothetical protein
MKWLAENESCFNNDVAAFSNTGVELPEIDLPEIL